MAFDVSLVLRNKRVVYIFEKTRIHSFKPLFPKDVELYNSTLKKN